MALASQNQVRFQLKLLDNVKYHYLDIPADLGEQMGWKPGFWHNLRDIHGLECAQSTKGNKFCQTIRNHFESDDEYDMHVKVIRLKDLKLKLGCSLRRERLSEHSMMKGTKVVMLHEVARQKLLMHSKHMRENMDDETRAASMAGLKYTNYVI